MRRELAVSLLITVLAGCDESRPYRGPASGSQAHDSSALQTTTGRPTLPAPAALIPTPIKGPFPTEPPLPRRLADQLGLLMDLEGTRNFPAAERLLLGLLEQEPNSSELWMLLGRDYMEVGDSGPGAPDAGYLLRAIDASERSISILPNHLAMWNLAASLTALGRPDEAEVVLRRLLTYETRDRRRELRLLAMVTHAQGRFAQSVPIYQEALAAYAPTLTPGMENLGFMQSYVDRPVTQILDYKARAESHELLPALYWR